jgi:hypothetical protein
MTAHQTADFDSHPGRGGWFSARCTCGFTEGPFPDLETMVDALMEHAALASTATPNLDAAWKVAEAALPEGWLLGSVARSAAYRGSWVAWATMTLTPAAPPSWYDRNTSGFGDTPAAALHALTARLEDQRAIELDRRVDAARGK